MKLRPLTSSPLIRAFVTDPAVMTPDQRLTEIASILAHGYRRTHAAARCEDELASSASFEPECALRTQENAS
ncbi:MAG: hypothetical protein IPN34_17185 [Planctomycetes bacterium]|nr:hypothetical protein [Planctomycetota bacterium]